MPRMIFPFEDPFVAPDDLDTFADCLINEAIGYVCTALGMPVLDFSFLDDLATAS